MGSFFSIDGPFYKFGSVLADIMYLSLLWGVFTIIGLGVTAGASTTALFFVATRRMSGREGYVFRDFWKSFKENFRQSTVIWLIILVIGTILLVNIFNMKYINIPDTIKIFLQPLQIVFLVELIAVTLYIFPVISRFSMSIKSMFVTSLYMIHRHFLSSLLLLMMTLVIVLACEQYPLFILIAIGVYGFSSSYLFMRIFRKYRPEIDSENLVNSNINELEEETQQ